MLRPLRRGSGLLARPAGGESFTARASAPSRVARSSDMVAFGAIKVWVPVVAFVFAFRLSMEYEVFLLSPIEECYDECGNNDEPSPTALSAPGRSRPRRPCSATATAELRLRCRSGNAGRGRSRPRRPTKQSEAAWRARRILKSRRSKLAPQRRTRGDLSRGETSAARSGAMQTSWCPLKPKL